VLLGFNFRLDTQEKLIQELSGAERNRVHLAKLFKKGHKFLLLDEPTNDLFNETQISEISGVLAELKKKFSFQKPKRIEFFV
jgi:ATPase subunit of ABC transporter with duplicated ATPase domains